MSNISDFIQGVAGGFFGGPVLRDYTHASKTFRTKNYENAPKLKFLFHVNFEINTDALPNCPSANWGLAVKSVKLPSFTMTTHEMNQYNRKRIVQTKIKYDPVDITFHDDNGTNVNGGMIRNLWKLYYQYYFADSKNPKIMIASKAVNSDSTNGSGYNDRTQYTPSITGDENWGYTGEASQSMPGLVKVPFFKSIRIFGFNQHNYVTYVLVNPMITRFGHDTYNYAEGNGTMENTMAIDYETVVYDSGAISGANPSNMVPGFGDVANYDKTLSPISRPGSQSTILGPGGLVDGVNGFSQAITDGNYLGALGIAGTSYNTFKNKNLGQILKGDVTSQILGAMNGEANPRGGVIIPLPTGTEVGTFAANLINKQKTPPTGG
jgi:hypothetical protein